MELEAPAADQPRMAFHDEPLERGGQLGDRRKIVRGNRAGIEKASRVVELQMLRAPRWVAATQFTKRPAKLLGDLTRPHGFFERVLPQVAHHAAERAHA